MNIYTPKLHQEDPDIIEEVPIMQPALPEIVNYFYMSALTPLQEGVSGNSAFFCMKDGMLSETTELSINSDPSEASIYYESLDLNNIRNSKLWVSDQSNSRTVRGLKWANGKSYIIQLGTIQPDSVTFIGWCGSSSRSLILNGEEYVSPEDKKEFFIKDFQGPFTGEINLQCGGDFYGILMLTQEIKPTVISPGYYLGWYDRAALRSAQDPSMPEEMPCWRILHVNTLDQENIKTTRNLYPQGDRSFNHIWKERHKYNYQYFI